MRSHPVPGGDPRQHGSVVVELLGLGFMLALPLLYVMVTLSHFERASLAAVTIADEASRVQANASDPDSAAVLRSRAVKEITRGHGLDPGAVSVELTCQGRCPGHGARVRVTATVRVALPLIPVHGTRIGSVTATSLAVAPRYG